MKKIYSPLTLEQIEKLKAGDELFLDGIIYTARDQAHQKMVEAIAKNKGLPFDIKGAVIYYCGPAKTPTGKAAVSSTALGVDSECRRVIGSCGPTTSSRMDKFTEPLLENGLKGMIGKGNRCQKVVQAVKRHKAVYFLTYAGCGALLTKFVRSARIIAYRELGPEAIHELKVENFPLIVGIDSRGRNVFARVNKKES